MPNVGGPREKKRRLVATVVQAKQLYAAPAWTESLKNRGISDELLSAQGGCAGRVVSAYRTVSTSAALVLASLPPVGLLARERQEVFQRNKDLVTSQGQSRNLAKAAIRKEARCRLLEQWQERWDGDLKGRWTYRLIPNLATLRHLV
ncbi:uncharacterized protein LOC122506292 [Leptopilina heterotoma]|uniref:uncharacterized protein LOC122506292 n=1 Tax=Leptopilina heterotoma TaxID=63436 RepID=UPI001CA93B10|nr:uncharacterized protein LOC122506292 [Leptopilina heterotoma]